MRPQFQKRVNMPMTISACKKAAGHLRELADKLDAIEETESREAIVEIRRITNALADYSRQLVSWGRRTKDIKSGVSTQLQE